MDEEQISQYDYQDSEYPVPRNPLKPQIKNDFALSEKLLKIEWNEHNKKYYPDILPDLAKSNLSPLTYAAVNKIAIAGVQTSFVGEALELDLIPAQNFLSQVDGIKINSARAKGGWSGMLAKTNKSISEETLYQKSQEIQELEHQKKKGFFGKLLGR